MTMKIKPKKCVWCKKKSRSSPAGDQLSASLQAATGKLHTHPVPHFFFSEYDTLWNGISLWSVGVGYCGSVLFQVLGYPQPARWWGGVRNWKRPWLYKHCSAITKAFLNYQQCFQHKSKTQHHIQPTVKKISSNPAKANNKGRRHFQRFLWNYNGL